MNQSAAAATKELSLPEPVARRGITEAQWRTLKNSLYPGAESDSVLMVWDYCKARQLDPMKKPCHIVPMWVTVITRDEHGKRNEQGMMRDVVMPGIYELRTTAMRTGLYAGQDAPVYGPIIEHKGVKAPEWCEITVRRILGASGLMGSFTHRELFVEACATKKDGALNSMWTKRPTGQLTKCAEAGVLRKAFPDELGGEHTIEEMEGQDNFIEGETAKTKPARQVYNDAEFKEKVEKWRPLVAGGQKGAEDLITMVESKVALADEQKAAIRALAPAGDAQ